jgi:hypothetical protein
MTVYQHLSPILATSCQGGIMDSIRCFFLRRQSFDLLIAIDLIAIDRRIGIDEAFVIGQARVFCVRTRGGGGCHDFYRCKAMHFVLQSSLPVLTAAKETLTGL